MRVFMINCYENSADMDTHYDFTHLLEFTSVESLALFRMWKEFA